MTAEDRLFLLDCMYEIKVTLHADGERLVFRGPADVLRAAEPMLRMHKPELLAYLRTTGATANPVDR